MHQSIYAYLRCSRISWKYALGISTRGKVFAINILFFLFFFKTRTAALCTFKALESLLTVRFPATC